MDEFKIRRVPRPWNKGKLVGQKTPLKLEEIWAIRVRLGVGTRVVRNRTLRSNGSGTHAARRSPAGRRSDLKPSGRCCSLSQV